MLKTGLRIHQNKLNFAFHIAKLADSTLAKQSFDIQNKLKFPGLLKEIKELIKLYSLPDCISERSKESKLSFQQKVKT